MPGTDVHPTDVALQAFTLGTLDGASDVSVEDHLTDCPSCQARAAGAPADTLVELLRSAHARPTVSEDTPAPSIVTATMLWSPTDLSAPSAPAELAGHARYRLLRQLGAGGMGAVWLAEHSVMGRQVALKVIRPEHLAKPGAAERFRREVHAAACLHHPNIVTAHDADQVGTTHFLVMEYVEGVSLAEHLERTGPLPVAEACRLARDAALGLQHAHEHGLIHRDVKPHNIMLTADGGVKILDFGLAALAAESEEVARLTGANMVVGTPDYIAPEQAEDAHAADIRSDVYSLGCTLYQMLAGRVPFPGDSMLRKLDAHRSRPPEPIRSRRLDVPTELTIVLARMMAKDPAGRYQTPGEVAAALAPFTGHGVVRPRRRWPFVAAAAVLFAGLAAATVAVYRVETDKGQLVITTESDDVEVVIKQNGKEVRVVDTKTDKSITLWSGEYELELKNAGKGLKLDIDKATLTRGETVLAKIERMKPAADEENVGEVRRFEGHTGDAHSVAYSPDGRYAVSGSGWPTGDRTIRVWEVATGKQIHTFDSSVGQVLCVAFSSDGRRILYGGDGNTAVLLDVATGKEVWRFGGFGDAVLSVAFSPNGRQIIVASQDCTARVLDADTGKELCKFEGHITAPFIRADGSHARVMQAAFTPDGKRAVSGGDDGSIYLWDVKTGEKVQSFEGSKGVHSVAISPDGRYVLSSSWEGKQPISLWDMATGKLVREFSGHEGVVYKVAFSHDGCRIISGSSDKTVRLWDVATGKELHCFTGHTDGIWGVAFSPDDRYALSASQDKTLRLWCLPDPPAAKDNP